MLQKLQQAQDKQGVEVPPELLSTHPLTQVGAVGIEGVGVGVGAGLQLH
jgi:hypothetical protein